MERDELKELWKNTGDKTPEVSRNKLEQILESKAKSTMNRFLMVFGIAGIISLSVITFVIITALYRKEDILYVINSTVLGILTIASLVSALWSLRRLSETKYSLPLKQLLEKNIKMISRSLNGWHRAVSILIIPVLFILLMMSINVYFSGMSYLDVISSGESVTALIAGLLVGLPISYYVENQFYRYHVKNLNEFKRLYKHLTEH